MPGKSTFLARVSAARPKIADYPFTTLNPQLGMVRIAGADFVVADLPGLIEGAHEGAGLGTRFLGHAERTRVILHLVDGTQSEIARAYKTIRHELRSYGHGLADKPEVVVLNKTDAIPDQMLKRKLASLERASEQKPLAMSGVSGGGVDEVLYAIVRKLTNSRAETSRSKRAGGRHEGSARHRTTDCRESWIESSCRFNRWRRQARLAGEFGGGCRGSAPQP